MIYKIVSDSASSEKFPLCFEFIFIILLTFNLRNPSFPENLIYLYCDIGHMIVLHSFPSKNY